MTGKELKLDRCPKCGGALIRRPGGILDCVKPPCKERFYPGGEEEWMSNRKSMMGNTFFLDGDDYRAIG
jgi:hypothetical protein